MLYFLLSVTIPMTALRYTPNEKFIVTAGLDGSIRVWTHIFKPVRPREHR